MGKEIVHQPQTLLSRARLQSPRTTSQIDTKILKKSNDIKTYVTGFEVT